MRQAVGLYKDIKIGQVADLEVALALSTEFLRESPYKGMPVDLDKYSGSLSAILKDINCGVVIFSLCNGTPSGLLVGSVSEVYFNREKVAFELMWYVREECRNTRTSMRMYDVYSYWAEHLAKVDYVQMNCLSDSNGDTLTKFYERKGFKMVEKGFIKQC
jgi:hypothetical protein